MLILAPNKISPWTGNRPNVVWLWGTHLHLAQSLGNRGLRPTDLVRAADVRIWRARNGNPGGQSTRRTQGRESVSQAIDRIRQFVERGPQERLTSLMHHLTVDALRWAFFALKRNAAAGADGVTWRRYEDGLEGRLADLHVRVHSGAYRATRSRRVNIPKPEGSTRPLGVAELEDRSSKKP